MKTAKLTNERRLDSILQLTADGAVAGIRASRQTLAVDPAVLSRAGVREHSRGRHEVASALFEWGFTITGHPSFLNKLGVSQIALERYDDAIGILAQAVALRSEFAEAWSNLGLALLRSTRTGEAEQAFRRSLELKPDLTEALANLAAALTIQGKHREAAVTYGNLVARNPDFSQAWLDLAECFAELSDLKRSEQCYRRTLELDPENPRAHLGIGNALCVLAANDQARQHFLRARTGEHAQLIDIRIAQIVDQMPDSVQALETARAEFEERIVRLYDTASPVPHLPAAFVTTNFALAYHGHNDRPVQEAWSRLLIKTCPALAWVSPHCFSARSGGGRIRIGFVSAHLKQHTIARFTNGLIRRLPRDRFEVFTFDLGGNEDADELPQISDRAIRCSGTVPQCRTEIAAEKLDIAFYPEIGMHPVVFQLAISRLAPLQCVTWGHPVTTGLPFIDWFISSDLIEPEGAEDHYSERLARFAALPTYYNNPAPELPATTHFTFPTDWRLYLCPQSLFKLHPAFDAVLAEILRRDPVARILLLSGGEHYNRAFQQRFGAAFPSLLHRIVILDRLPRPHLLELMHLSHVMLDTHPFGGGNTSYEALAFGTPVITWPGEFMRGRVTLGCYRKMGFDHCVASSADEYVEKAVRIAGSRDERAWASEEIRSRSAVLYEDRTAVIELADFLESALAEATA